MSARFVYRVYDADARLIYVGETGNLFQRLDTHAMQTWWAPQVAHVKATVYPSRELALAAERACIRHEDPRWNITGSWRRHRSWTADRYVDYVTAYINNRATSAPPRLTCWGQTHVANVARLYRARFGHDLPISTESVA